MKYDFITIGGATEDITFFTQEGVLIDNKKDVLRQKLLGFEYGAKIKIDQSYSSFGGGAANTAVNLAGLGFKVASIIAVGDDERGKRILANLKKKKVLVSLAQKIKDKLTGFSLILINPEKIIFTSRAANEDLRLSSADLRMLGKTKWAYITSLSGKWEEILRKVFSVKNIKTAWNPGGVQLKGGVKKIGKYLKKTTVLFVNKDEAIELVISDPRFKNKDNKYLNNTKNLLMDLKAMGPEIVVVTNGKRGADVYSGLNFYHQDILKERQRVDTTGVGDAFNSSFVAGLELYKGDIQKAMHLGVKVAASAVAHQGAQNGLIKISKL